MKSRATAPVLMFAAISLAALTACGSNSTPEPKDASAPAQSQKKDQGKKPDSDISLGPNQKLSDDGKTIIDNSEPLSTAAPGTKPDQDELDRMHNDLNDIGDWGREQQSRSAQGGDSSDGGGTASGNDGAQAPQPNAGGSSGTTASGLESLCTAVNARRGATSFFPFLTMSVGKANKVDAQLNAMQGVTSLPDGLDADMKVWVDYLSKARSANGDLKTLHQLQTPQIKEAAERLDKASRAACN